VTMNKKAFSTILFTDYSQADTLAVRYKSVNFSAPKRPGSPNQRAQIDWDRASGVKPPWWQPRGKSQVNLPHILPPGGSI
jgi:hypothetical protein